MSDKGINIKDRDFILCSRARVNEPEILFLYKVRHRYKTGYKEYWFYAGTEIEEFLNKNNIEYVRNMIHPLLKPFIEEFIENDQEK